MLYIQKTQPSPELIDFIVAEKRKFLSENKIDKHPSYITLQSDIKSYKPLRKQLYKEQRGLCCYCMKKITVENSSIEHFLPESIFPENETDYFNLYLACRYSEGLKGGKQYCDKSKGNKLIGKYIGYLHNDSGKNVITKCEDLIQYNEDGYILPNKTGFKTIRKFYTDYSSLAAQEKELLGTIEILNLNCKSLVNERAKFIADFKITIIPKLDDILSINKKVEFYQTVSTPFAGVALYFLKERWNKLS